MLVGKFPWEKIDGKCLIFQEQIMLHLLREGIGFKPLIEGKENMKKNRKRRRKKKEEEGKARVSSVPSGSNNEV